MEVLEFLSEHNDILVPVFAIVAFLYGYATSRGWM